jgi:NAD(P)-dependent dehydrogenase (short-subunit alcohol dehydrogenase family)
MPRPGIGVSTVKAFAPTPQAVLSPVPPDRFVRRCWHVIGCPRHPVAAELRARSAAVRVGADGRPASPPGTAVLVGRELGWEDNARLLDGVHAALRDSGRLVLVHLGAGGGSLLRVAAKEEPRLDAVTIELAERPTERASRVAVTLASSDGAGPRDLRVGNDGAVTAIGWQPAELPPADPPDDPPDDPRGRPPGAVVVTGGLGGLGLRAAAVLAELRGLRPVLVDTAEPDRLPTGAAQHLRRLAAGPAGVTVLNADITDPAATRAALSTVDGLTVRAVLHCAGTLHSGPLSGLTWYDLASAQRVKVDGLRNVLAALDPGELRHLITFGSITAEIPHRGMACYALANELLCRATLRAARELPQCATVAAQWSLWSGAGMAQQAGAVPQARRMGLTPVPLRSGMLALLRLLGWPRGPATAAPLLLYGDG